MERYFNPLERYLNPKDIEGHKILKRRLGHNRYNSTWPRTSARIKEERGYICNGCGRHFPDKKKGQLIAHHLNDNHYDDHDENIVLYCGSCHAKIHNFLGHSRGILVKQIRIFIVSPYFGERWIHVGDAYDYKSVGPSHFLR